MEKIVNDQDSVNLSPAENQPEKKDEIYRELMQRGVASEGRVGKAAAHLIDAHGLNEMHRALAARGCTIYVPA